MTFYNEVKKVDRFFAPLFSKVDKKIEMLFFKLKKSTFVKKSSILNKRNGKY